ncbi:MAG: hypothetical protein EKK39_13350 [Sphingobacteriales bacterium]|nr:MAG: hypothetical protein EKK39_13350 [Sphingobacteriales bacterium]
MNTRYRCPAPNCGKDKTFSRYIDTETGEHVHPTVGRCNRENNCGYHYTPKQYFQDNNISFDTPQPKAYKPHPVTLQPKPVSFIPVDIFKASLNPTAFEANYFVQFLINLFGVDVASELVSRYFIGTSKHWNGATVFWQIDTQGKVRTGKIMLYNPTTGKRVKNLEPPVYWVHKALKQPEFELRQCLFGEHLLIDKIKPVAIVESEKTAIIASIYLPQFIWLAAGSLTNLNAENCSILKGRTVTLFPDLNGFEKWSNKAKELSHLANFTVSDLLERKATKAERKQGLDLADYLIRYDYKKFALHETILPLVQSNKPITAIQNNLLNIHSDDVLVAPVTTYLSKDFNNAIILYVETTTGKFDFLFDSEGELLQPGNEKVVADIEIFFEKQFAPGLMDGIPCFIHSHYKMQ